MSESSQPATDADITSYEASIRADPGLGPFGSTIHLRTVRALNSFAGAGSNVPSLSPESLREVTRSLLEMNQEFVKVILDCKRDVWRNKDLSDLVDDYFDNTTLITQDFCTALDSCLKRAARIESVVNAALGKFHEEEGISVSSYSKTLEELRNLRVAGGVPFTRDFFRVFDSVNSKQDSMLERLKVMIGELDRKKKKKLRKWRKQERDLREIIGSMQTGSYIVLKDLYGIRLLVDKAQSEIVDLLANADLVTRGEEGVVVIAVEEIMKKVDVFLKTVHDLSEQGNTCAQEVKTVQTLILGKIARYPAN